MRSQRQSSTVRSIPAGIETLEKRGYLSASALMTCPDVSAAAPVQTSIAAPLNHASTSKISPSKVVTPVDLTPEIDGIVKRNINGKVITVEIFVHNAGPTTAKGPLRISIEFSYYRTGVDPRLFRTVTTPINIKAGGSKTVRTTGAIPKSFPTFDYHMVVVLNGNKKIPETNYANDTEITAGYFYLA